MCKIHNQQRWQHKYIERTLKYCALHTAEKINRSFVLLLWHTELSVCVLSYYVYVLQNQVFIVVLNCLIWKQNKKQFSRGEICDIVLKTSITMHMFSLLRKSRCCTQLSMSTMLRMKEKKLGPFSHLHTAGKEYKACLKCCPCFEITSKGWIFECQP